MADPSWLHSSDAVKYLVDHVFLPPSLPGGDDHLVEHDQSLISCVKACLEDIEKKTTGTERAAFRSALTMVGNLQSVQNDLGFVHQKRLENILSNLDLKCAIVLHVKVQNAGLIIRHEDEGVVIEAFEISPSNAAVITTKGRLRRYFPQAAVSIPLETFRNEDFRSALSSTISKMSSQSVTEMKAQAVKAGKSHVEERDTTSPRIVTELLMNFLRANGSSTQVEGVWKCTREEVMWSDSHKLPWRRSAIWLLLRVSLQRELSRFSPDLYKQFQVVLMSKILFAAYKNGMSSGILYAMNAKIAQRGLKLELQEPKDWMASVPAIISEVSEYLEKRWAGVQSKLETPRLDLKSFSHEQATRDCALNVPGLDSFIQSIFSRQRIMSDSIFEPSTELWFIQDNNLPNLSGLGIESPYADSNLAAFERWVEEKLDSWLLHRLKQDTTCFELSQAIRQYHSMASEQYKRLPEGISIMLLTIMELWIASDKSAVEVCPLLAEYGHGIPSNILSPLLLKEHKDMARLLRAEQYLEKRQGAAKVSCCIFSHFGSKSFAARYFAESTAHHSLLYKIEQWAQEQREKKVKELADLKTKYRDLMRLYDENDCDKQYYMEYGVQLSRHPSSCQRCGYHHQALGLDIEAFEWPLPTSTVKAHCTVFELDVPRGFSIWRDLTWFIHRDVLQMSTQTRYPQSENTLSSYNNLRRFYNEQPGSTIILLSEAKPHNRTHRRDQLVVNVTERDVCLENGLMWEYFDVTTKSFVRPLEQTEQTTHFCTYSLPGRSSAMQKFLHRPPERPDGEAPNGVISCQADCPQHLSLEEFKALANQGLGHQIEWLNILTQLAMPSIDWKRTETVLVLLQLSQQCGPTSGAPARKSHEILRNERFAACVLKYLNISLDRVTENWESCQAVVAFSIIANRLLSLGPTTLQNACLEFLQRCRETCLIWIEILSAETASRLDDDHGFITQERLFEIALICADSFNVDRRFLEDLLSSDEVARAFLICAMAVQQNMLRRPDAETLQGPLLYRWRVLMFRSAPLLRDRIVNQASPCLDDAIQHIWPAYAPAREWKANDKADYWLESGTSNDHSTPVQFNLVLAEFRINGLPFGRLPFEVEHNKSYNRLFDHHRLEVAPSTEPGMRFSAKKWHAGYKIHLGTQASMFDATASDLLIRAYDADSTRDFIPAQAFIGKLPSRFINEFVHWYDHGMHCVEFCPSEKPWTSDPMNWRMVKIQNHWRLLHDNMGSLISPLSKTSEVLLNVFQCLETRLGLHIYQNQAMKKIVVELPRLQLSFELSANKNFLQSIQFRGKRVDESQETGTLIGLNSKLVLRSDSDPKSRMILIPEGIITWNSCGNPTRGTDHINVSIDMSVQGKVYAYHIDTDLGQLVGTGSLQNSLLLAYLHGLTSYCLPDPLTGHTGTERALSILKSAAVRSFTCLSQENMDMLKLISQLTPGRSYYPQHLREMQVVKWDTDLDPLSQHGEFCESVLAIYNQATDTKIFYRNFVNPPKLNHVDIDLLERDSMRTSTYRVAGFGAEKHDKLWDRTYPSRAEGQDSARAVRAFHAAMVFARGEGTIASPVPNDMVDRIYCLLSGQQQVTGPEEMDHSNLSYDCDWLKDPKGILQQYWCRFHFTLSHTMGQLNRYNLMLWLATIAYSTETSDTATSVLIALACVPKVRQVTTNAITSCKLSMGTESNLSTIQQVVGAQLKGFGAPCPEQRLSPHQHETRADTLQRRREAFFSARNVLTFDLANKIHLQWRNRTVREPQGTDYLPYIRVREVMQEVETLFENWTKNEAFANYLKDIYSAMRSTKIRPIETPALVLEKSSYVERIMRRSVSMSQILVPSSVPDEAWPDVSFHPQKLIMPKNPMSDPRLTDLLDRCSAKASSQKVVEYFDDLRKSAAYLADFDQQHVLLLEGENLEKVLGYYKDSVQATHDTIYNSLIQALGRHQRAAPNGNTAVPWAVQLVAMTHHWPRISPLSILEQLARRHWQHLVSEWRHIIVRYGVSLTDLQRSRRLLRQSGNHVDLIKELQNEGHRNWCPSDSPESLLLEIEAGLMIRGVQKGISKQMRDPPEGQNAVMQLNMGEGKSSVIVPDVASSLADGTKLVRVIVAKPQSKQMLEMLVSKLGGLLGRRVYHMPFCRGLQIGEQEADAIHRLYKECMSSGGVLLVQPEHILSFQLMGIECFLNDRQGLGEKLLRTLHFFNTSSRDIIDESDENFSAKFELVYTIGKQRPIEDSPGRWKIIHEVLDLVSIYSSDVAERYPQAMEVHRKRHGQFSNTRILRPEAHDEIIKVVAKHICRHGISGLPVSRQPKEFRKSVFRYLTELDLTDDEITAVEKSHFWGESTAKFLLLIRGLFANHILWFALGQNRWRVNYGLDELRKPPTKLAVPFRAKDCPSERSEFSHPDVVIVLTSLCYYYGGISDEDLFLVFGELLKADQREIEYQVWVASAPDLPISFQHLQGVNMKDRQQCISHLFPHFRFSKAVIDYFLSFIVFPKDMKEFPFKLSASGWDLGQVKNHPTTGFSGTNDSQHVLPIDMKQLDLPEQKHTNALVLEHLLRPENSVVLVPRPKDGAAMDSQALLTMIGQMKRETQVILDVGAQIIELSNLEVAQAWLDLLQDRTDVQGVVFCNEVDELSVLDRRGYVELLQTSPLAKQLHSCRIFLDQAHTRGIDLKLPPDYQAAVTLGAGLTKDRLVQACMRMRKLGFGQSIVFCVTEEIKAKILETKGIPPAQSIEVADIIEWAMVETNIDLRRMMPLWANQGQCFRKQNGLWDEAKLGEHIKLNKALAEKFLEDDAHSLESRYRPRSTSQLPTFTKSSGDMVLDKIVQRCQDFEITNTHMSTLQEEQERELAPEVEKERQVERPPPEEPREHEIHPHLRAFIISGNIQRKSSGFLSAFQALQDTTAADHLDVGEFPPGLWVTQDFARTIKNRGSITGLDSYKRSVQFVLTGKAEEANSCEVVVISPFEANKLLDTIRTSKTTVLHLYAPRQNQGYAALDCLQLYTIPEDAPKRALPRNTIIELNLFAGQLYFSSFKEYTEVCDYLGLAWSAAEDGMVVRADGFIEVRQGGERKSSFSKSPVQFLKTLLTKIRRDCKGIEKTHVGKMLDGALLLEEDFEEPSKHKAEGHVSE